MFGVFKVKSFLISLKPFLSVTIMTHSMLLLAYVQLEERRVHYQVYQLNREHLKRIDEKRAKHLSYLKLTGLKAIANKASRLSLVEQSKEAEVILVSLP